MDYAKDGRGKYVTASEAAAGLFYRCPECRADVFLKSGKWNRTHFAHRPGQGTAKCELFHPSNYLSGPSPRHDFDADPNAPPILPISLSIELDPTPQSRLNGNRDWKLALTVPKAPDTHGSVRIDCGTGTPRLISLTKLALDAQTYPASLSAEDFGATWISPEVNPRYKIAIEHRIPGLNRLFVNAFVNSKQKQKPLATSLTWGGTYYLISHDSLPIEIPTSLPNSQLAKRDNWVCSIVTLPDDEDDDIRRWIPAEEPVRKQATDLAPLQRLLELDGFHCTEEAGPIPVLIQKDDKRLAVGIKSGLLDETWQGHSLQRASTTPI